MYEPDNWVVIKLISDQTHYRVLVGWSGGYLSSDTWKMNSGITKAEFDGTHYHFHGVSGSVYKCHKNMYCLRKNNTYVWNKLQEIHGDKVQLMDENSDWVNFDWLIE